MPHVRTAIPPLVGGLNLIANPLAGNTVTLTESRNLRIEGFLTAQRPGFRVLDIEPSYLSSGVAKDRMALLFVSGSLNYLQATGFAQTLGLKWTIRLEYVWATSPALANATGTLLDIYDGTNLIVRLTAQGNGTQVRLQMIVRDAAGNQITSNTIFQTVAQWSGDGDGRFITMTRDGANLSLKIGQTEMAWSSSFSQTEHAPATTLTVGTLSVFGPGVSADGYFFGLTIVNRILDESDLYWGIQYPMEKFVSDAAILGHWPVIQGSGSTIKDFSVYEADLSSASMPTWTTGSHRFSRGLGIAHFRKKDGSVYYMIAAGRNGTSSAGAAPTGAVYAWRAKEAELPFYFGGDPGADDSTAALDGLDLLARVRFETLGDLCGIFNGVDYSRKFNGTTFYYFGLGAPPLGPILTAVGFGGAMSAGTYKFCYSYYNSLTGTESGRSPITTVTVVGNDSVSIEWFLTADTQANHVRIYCSQSGQDQMYLVASPGINTQPYTYVRADVDIVNFPLVPRDEIKRLYLQGGPPVAPTVGAAAGTSTGTYLCAYSYYNSVTGEESGMSPMATFVAAAQGFAWSNLIVPSLDGYDKMRLYRTKAGGKTLYLAAEITSAAAAGSENTVDGSLTATTETRALPPKFRYVCQFAGRLFGAEEASSTLWWSSATGLEDFNYLSGHNANPGAIITGIGATDGVMLVSYSDGSVYVLPHPGDLLDLELFVPVQMREYSSVGGCIAHDSIQKTDIGLMWLAETGIYRLTQSGLELVSASIDPFFFTLNRELSSYATSMYDTDNHLYRVWLARGDARLRMECVVLDTRNMTFTVDDLLADVAGVLLDAKYERRFCFMTPMGVLNEFHDRHHYSDGDGAGTTYGTVVNAGINGFDDIGGYSPPAGGDGGFPVYLRKDDGTVIQRWVIPSDLAIAAGADIQFFPSASEIETGTWTAYMNGIRMSLTTMALSFGERRKQKTLDNVFVANDVGTGGTLQLWLGVDRAEPALVSGGTADLTAIESLVNMNEVVQSSGRVFAIKVTHDPPVAGENAVLESMEAEWSYEESDQA